MVQWTDKRLLDKPDVIRSKFCPYLFQQTMVQVLYVRRNIRFRADELVCAVLNVNRKPIYWSCGRQEKEMEQLGNVWIWNGNIMMKESYGSYSIRIMNWNIPVGGLCVQRKWIRTSLERVKRSKSSIRSKCHRVIGIFPFSLFMMHVQGCVPNLRDCASMMLSKREGKECYYE